MAAEPNSDVDEVPSITVGDWCSVEYEVVIYPEKMKAVGADN